MTKHRVDIDTGQQLRKLGWAIAKYLRCSEHNNLNDTGKDINEMKACAELYFTNKNNGED